LVHGLGYWVLQMVVPGTCYVVDRLASKGGDGRCATQSVAAGRIDFVAFLGGVPIGFAKHGLTHFRILRRRYLPPFGGSGAIDSSGLMSESTSYWAKDSV